MTPYATEAEKARQTPLERKRIVQAHLDDVIRYASPWAMPAYFEATLTKEDVRECFGTAIAGAWAAREGGSVNTPLTLPGHTSLEYWIVADRGVTLGTQTLATGSGAPVAPTLSGTLTQSFALDLPISLNGARGAAKFDVLLNGALYVSGLTTGASVAIPNLNITTAWVTGSYTTAHSYASVSAQWDDQSSLARSFVAPSTVTTRPNVKGNARAGRPTLTSDGTGSKNFKDVTSNVASNLGTGTAKDRTFYLMCKSGTTTPGSTNAWISLNSTSDADPGFKICQRNGTNDYALIAVADAGGAASTIHGGALDSSYHVLTALVSGTTVTLEDENGSVIATGTQSVGAQTFNSLMFFADNFGGTAGHAAIAEIGESMGYSAAHDSVTRGILRNWTRNGWGF